MVYFCPRMSTSTRCLSAIAPHHSPLTLPSPQRGEGVSIPSPCPLPRGEREFQFPTLPSPQRGEGVSIPYPALSPTGRGSFDSLTLPSPQRGEGVSIPWPPPGERFPTPLPLGGRGSR